MKSRGLVLDGIAVLVAVALSIAPPSPQWVEHAYANGIYPPMQTAFTTIANLVPFALTDLIAALVFGGLIVWWIARIRRARAKWPAAAMMTAHTIGIAALLAIVFLCNWGFNYRRPPMATRIAFTPASVTPAAVDAYVRDLVADLNRTAVLAHAKPLYELQMTAQLTRDFEPVVRALGDERDVTLTRPKSTLINRYLSFAGIGGLFDPFAYETIVNADFLPFERPFAIAHEWGHAAAFADETDANYIAALTTLRSPEPFIRYSGLVWTYAYLPHDLTAKYPLNALVTEDLKNSYKRYTRYLNRIVFSLQWSAYDRYLKVNRVTSGVTSYSLFVNLLVGTPRDARGLPLVHGGVSTP